MVRKDTAICDWSELDWNELSEPALFFTHSMSRVLARSMLLHDESRDTMAGASAVGPILIRYILLYGRKQSTVIYLWSCNLTDIVC